MRGRRRFIGVAGVLALAMAFVPPTGTSAATGATWRQKVAARVLRETAGGRTAGFVVMLASQADLSGAAALPTKLAKGRFAFDALRTEADRTQAPIRSLLNRSRVSYRGHWVVNLI